MSVPQIAVFNFSALPDQAAQRAVRAVNRQVVEDFQPIWGIAYESRLLACARSRFSSACTETLPAGGETVIYLVDQTSIVEALGHYDRLPSTIPVGFVFTDFDDWTVTFSHEVLELIVDPGGNRLVIGPDPRQRDNQNAWLLHPYEVCDAVESTAYEIDHTRVSNFVTPHYFAEGNAATTRNDFLGVGVDVFGVTFGSRTGAIDPSDFSWVEILGRDFPSCSTDTAQLNEFGGALRPRDHARTAQRTLESYKTCPLQGGTGLDHLTALTREERKRRRMAGYRLVG